MNKVYKLSNFQKKEILRNCNELGTEINKIYTSLSNKYTLQPKVKMGFTRLSMKLSKIHSLIIKCLERE